jgi:hypothetical protein
MDQKKVQDYKIRFKNTYTDKDPNTLDADWIAAMVAKRARFRGHVNSFATLVVEAIGWANNICFIVILIYYLFIVFQIRCFHTGDD